MCFCLFFWLMSNAEAVWHLRTSERTLGRCYSPIGKEDLEGTTHRKEETQSLMLCTELLSWVSTFILELTGPWKISSEMPLSANPNEKPIHSASISPELQDHFHPNMSDLPFKSARQLQPHWVCCSHPLPLRAPSSTSTAGSSFPARPFSHPRPYLLLLLLLPPDQTPTALPEVASLSPRPHLPDPWSFICSSFPGILSIRYQSLVSQKTCCQRQAMHPILQREGGPQG